MKKGFTLIEILVTVTIIAVLLAVAAVSYRSINQRSRDARRRSDVEQLRSSLEMYRTDNGSYPSGIGWEGTWVGTDNSDLATLLESYLSPLPVDPTGGVDGYYFYTPRNCSGSPSKCFGYCILSYMEQDGSAVSQCASGYPSVSAVTGRTESLVKNP